MKIVEFYGAENMENIPKYWFTGVPDPLTNLTSF